MDYISNILRPLRLLLHLDKNSQWDYRNNYFPSFYLSSFFIYGTSILTILKTFLPKALTVTLAVTAFLFSKSLSCNDSGTISLFTEPKSVTSAFLLSLIAVKVVFPGLHLTIAFSHSITFG